MSELVLSFRDLPAPARVWGRSSDERLAQLASRGSAQAFAALYERHHQALYRYCRSILRQPEDARDALQSTMMRAFAALRSAERDVAVRPWLFRIAHNESISILRRRRAGEHAVPEDQPGGFDVERAADQRARLALLVADLQTLAERQRAALVMRELSGLSIEEIAAALQCSPGTAKQALFEARTSLHELSEGRAMDCEAIRQAISQRDGRVVRGRKLRAHLRACAGCREFETAIGARRADLRALAPPLPPAAGIALLRQLLAGGGHAGRGLAGTAGTSAGGTVVPGTGSGAAGLTGTGSGGVGLPGIGSGATGLTGTGSAGASWSGASAAGTSAGAAGTVGGHLAGSLMVKALIGAAVVALATTGAARLALRPAHSGHQATVQGSANGLAAGGVAEQGRGTVLIRSGSRIPPSGYGQRRVTGAAGALATGRNQPQSVHDLVGHALPPRARARARGAGQWTTLGRSTGGVAHGQAPTAQRPVGAEHSRGRTGHPRGQMHASAHRPPADGKAGESSGGRGSSHAGGGGGNHAGGRSGGHTGGRSGTGSANAHARTHGQLTTTAATPGQSPPSQSSGRSYSPSGAPRSHSGESSSTRAGPSPPHPRRHSLESPGVSAPPQQAPSESAPAEPVPEQQASHAGHGASQHAAH